MSHERDGSESRGQNTPAKGEFTGGSKRNLVTVYSRLNCHLCDVAFEELISLKAELDFDLRKISIEGDPELEGKYGDKIPVILIDGEHHDFWRLNPARFRSSLERHRQRQ